MRVCVVGAAGASGAAACRALSDAGHIVVPLDESAAPGGVWKELAPNFVADTTRAHMRLCGSAMGSGDDGKGYPLAEEVLSHVRKVARSSALYMHRVTRVERVNMGKWQVGGAHAETGVQFCIDVDAVVVATGACAQPFYPPFARACFAQQQQQQQLQQQQPRKQSGERAPKRRVRSQGMTVVHSHYFPWKHAQEFAGQVGRLIWLHPALSACSA